MDNLKNQIKCKQIRASSSQINIKPKSKTEDLVILINNLNSDIKLFYQIIKKYLKEARQNINNNSLFPQQVFDLIEQCLNEFINKAKDTFKKMKYTHKINVIQQEINNNILNNNKIKLNSEDIYFNYNYNNDKRDKYFNEKKLLLDDEYLSSLCNNTSTSIKINNYFDNNNINNLNNINQYNNQYYPNKIQKINKVSKSNNKFPQQILSQIYKKNSSNPNLFSDQKVKCYEYNGLKERKNNKSVSNLRKKKFLNRNSYSNKSLGKISYYNNTDATSHNNFYSSKKEILNNLNNIISSLNEIKLIKGNIFNKSWEAEEYQKLLNVIINQLDKLIKNIFDENKNLYKKSPTISLFNENDDNSANISGNSLIKKKEESFNNNSLINNNGGYNLTYNYKNFDKNDEDTLNSIKNFNKNKKVYYDLEIRTRDLIIGQLKNELNMKIKTVHNQNIRYNQLKSRISKNNKFKSESNSNSKEKKPVIKNDNLNVSKISKMNVEIMEKEDSFSLDDNLTIFEVERLSEINQKVSLVNDENQFHDSNLVSLTIKELIEMEMDQYGNVRKTFWLIIIYLFVLNFTLFSYITMGPNFYIYTIGGDIPGEYDNYSNEKDISFLYFISWFLVVPVFCLNYFYISLRINKILYIKILSLILFFLESLTTIFAMQMNHYYFFVSFLFTILCVSILEDQMIYFYTQIIPTNFEIMKMNGITVLHVIQYLGNIFGSISSLIGFLTPIPETDDFDTIDSEGQIVIIIQNCFSIILQFILLLVLFLYSNDFADRPIRRIIFSKNSREIKRTEF